MNIEDSYDLKDKEYKAVWLYKNLVTKIIFKTEKISVCAITASWRISLKKAFQL